MKQYCTPRINNVYLKLSMLLFFVFTLFTMVRCSSEILQYKPLVYKDTILKMSNQGGRNFYLDKDIVLKTNKIYLHVKGTTKNLKIHSYYYSVFGNDNFSRVDSDTLSPILKKQLQNENVSCFTVFRISYLDKKGNSHFLENSGKYRCFNIWIKKIEN